METDGRRSSSTTLAGQYASSAPLGRGEITEAIRVRTHRGETRVLKRLRPELVQRPEIASWFCEEAHRSLGFVHPGAVSLVSIERSSRGAPHVLTEHVAGRSVAQLLTLGDKKRPLPVEVAVYIAGELLTVLASAHERAVPLIHSGIRPTLSLIHIFVSSDGAIAAGWAFNAVADRSPAIWNLSLIHI